MTCPYSLATQRETVKECVTIPQEKHLTGMIIAALFRDDSRNSVQTRNSILSARVDDCNGEG